MEVNQEGRLLSYGSHAPITGYAYQYEVEKSAKTKPTDNE